MYNIYIYVLNTLADWEIGHVTSEINSRRFFRQDAPQVTIKTVSCSPKPIKTMGGIKITPDCTIDDIVMSETSMLILPGADTWSNPENAAILGKSDELLSIGGTVCAICGATVALAGIGLLNNRPHTSNGPGFLDMFCPDYTGQSFYVDVPAVNDDNLITAACTGALEWTRQIIKHLDVFSADTLDAWNKYFSTGKTEHFYALMQSLPAVK